MLMKGTEGCWETEMRGEEREERRGGRERERDREEEGEKVKDLGVVTNGNLAPAVCLKHGSCLNQEGCLHGGEWFTCGSL